MDLHIKRIACFCTLFLPAFVVAQSHFAENATGTKDDKAASGMFKRVDMESRLSKAKAASLKKSLSVQLNTFFQMPQLNPPVGFSTRTGFSVLPASLPDANPLATTGIDMGMYYLVKDPQTGAVKVSMDGTSIKFQTNDIGHIVRDQGNFVEDCRKLKISLFFEKFPVVDSTADYLELNFRSYRYGHTIPAIPIRIVRSNNKPLFVPYTRKEYLQYLIAKKDYEIKDEEDIIADLKKTMEETKKSLSSPYYNAATKEALSKSIKTQEGQVSQFQARIKSLQDKRQHYQEVMKAMPPGEATAPAWVNEQKMGPEMDYLDMLAAYGRQDGDPLYKVNPDYFDKSAQAPGAQLIIVYYNLPHLSVYEQPRDYLQQKTVDIFNQIDYHRLKESMR